MLLQLCFNCQLLLTYRMRHATHRYQELLEQLQDQLVAPLNGYLQRFPDVKARIQKRDRRALDFDRTKRQLDNAKEKGSSKVGQAEEAFTEAETLFTEINTEIHDLLPSFYHGRIAFYASMLQSLYTTESAFFKTAEEVCLAHSCERAHSRFLFLSFCWSICVFVYVC